GRSPHGEAGEERSAHRVRRCAARLDGDAQGSTRRRPARLHPVLSAKDLAQPARTPRSVRTESCRGLQFAGSTAAAPRFFTSTTTNFAGRIVLALRPTVWMSVGPS